MFLHKFISQFETVIVSNPILLRSWYEMISLLDRDKKGLLLNYGYQGNDRLRLSKDEEVNRYRLQLYYVVGKQVSLRDKQILEVGCGRGGGANFISVKFLPKSYIGVDFSSLAIRFCKSYYQNPRLSFVNADAHNLPLKDQTYDVVINIESAHLYKNKGQFFKEAYRVLKPNGYFLLADIRAREEVSEVGKLIVKVGFKEIKVEDITRNVLAGLDKDNRNKLSLIRNKVPGVLQEPFKVFSGVKGSPNYVSFKTRQRTYWLSVYKK